MNGNLLEGDMSLLLLPPGRIRSAVSLHGCSATGHTPVNVWAPPTAAQEHGDYMCPLSAMVEILGSYTVLGNRIWKRKVGEGLGEVIIWLHR